MGYSIKLNNNDGFRWHSAGSLSIRGYFYLDGAYAVHDDVLDYFAEACDKETFLEKLRNIDGCYSIVADLEDGVIGASDHLRSFPLFYSENGDFTITDDAGMAVEMSITRKINHNGLTDYLHSGCVFYNETLIEDIYQVSAMHYIYFDKGSGRTEYGKHMTIYDEPYSIFDTETAEKILDERFMSAARRLVDSLEGRTAVVALSGGVDSRACLMMLRLMKYENVICFTYGWDYDGEMEPARLAAENLGYEHVFIKHDKKLWKKAYKDKFTLNYIKYTNNLSAIAHMESHFVTRHLVETEMVPRDSVFITGHLGIIANGKFWDKDVYSYDELISMYWEYWMKLYHFKGKRKKYYSERLSGYIGNEENYSNKEAETAFENASYDTIRGKHIINSHRQFEMFGFEWRVPLMDRELMKAFEHMCRNTRNRKKKFFTEYVVNHTGTDIGEARCMDTFRKKAFKNLSNPVYRIITPWRFLFSGYPGTLLPPFPVRQYRFLRRFYSYCALQEIGIIKEEYGLTD